MATAKKDSGAMARKKALAYELYMNSDMTQDEICDKLDIANRTLWKWKTDNNWEEERAATRITSRQIVLGLYKRLNTLIESKGSPDEIAKLAVSIERLKDEKVSISAIINSFKEFTTWAFAKNPALAREIVSMQNQFVTEKIANLDK